MKRVLLGVVSVVGFGTAVLGTLPSSAIAEPSHDHHHGDASPHGTEIQLGDISLLGMNFTVVQFGGLAVGRESAFGVTSSGELGDASVYLWVESASGERLSSPAQAISEGGRLHFHVVPKGAPAAVVIRVRRGSEDVRGSIKLSVESHSKLSDDHGHDHGHDHSHTHDHP